MYNLSYIPHLGIMVGKKPWLSWLEYANETLLKWNPILVITITIQLVCHFIIYFIICLRYFIKLRIASNTSEVLPSNLSLTLSLSTECVKSINRTSAFTGAVCRYFLPVCQEGEPFWKIIDSLSSCVFWILIISSVSIFEVLS